MESKNIIMMFAIALIAVIFISGCANTENNTKTETNTNTNNQTNNTPMQSQNLEPIKIGSIGIYSGDGSAWGIAAKNGIDMAISDINAKGGVNGRMLVVDHQDDKGNPANSINAFRNLVDIKNIKIIVGPTWSATGIPLIELANSSKVLMISPSLGKPEFNEQSKYLFNTWPHDYILSMNLADYVYNKGYKKVAIIGAEELWVKDQTAAFIKRFTELGGTVVVTVEPIPTEKDVSADALKIKSADIDAIVSTTDGVLVGSLVAKRVRELGVSKPIYSITIDKDAIASAQGAYEGMEFLTFLNPSQEFKDKYFQQYGTTTDIGGPNAYDAVMLIAQAIEKTGSTDPTILADYLATIKEYDGVSGKLVSDGKRGFTMQYKIQKVINGTIVDIG